MIKDASRSTVIIIAVIAVACIASGLAYTAMVINSDNSSSAEYGLVTTADNDLSTILQDGTTLTYTNQGNPEGHFYLTFTFALDADYVQSLDDDEFVVVTLVQGTGQQAITYRYTTTSPLATTSTVVGTALSFTNHTQSYQMTVTLSDGVTKLNQTEVTGLSITAHYMTSN